MPRFIIFYFWCICQLLALLPFFQLINAVTCNRTKTNFWFCVRGAFLLISLSFLKICLYFKLFIILLYAVWDIIIMEKIWVKLWFCHQLAMHFVSLFLSLDILHHIHFILSFPWSLLNPMICHIMTISVLFINSSSIYLILCIKFYFEMKGNEIYM